MDYRDFLAKQEPLVLPYFGGTRVDAKARTFRVEGQPALGWWRFQIDGRRAVPTEPASAHDIDLGSLPVLRGHWVDGWVVVDGKTLGKIALPPDDEPAPLSRVTARRWYSGDVLFETTEFEDDAELAAREALEHGRPLGDVKGVVPSLRAAFGYALGIAAARELSIDVTPRELASRVIAIADGGRAVVTEMFEALVEQRRREAEETRRRIAEAEQAARLAGAVRGARVVERARDPVQRADEALASARARMLSCRRVAGGAQLDVTYHVDGERIMSIVDAQTLQVIDPGVCLSGAHRVLTLDAMPSVVREAIDDDALNITRHH
ncbi:MAG: hypothetical protein H0T46_31320 [Deltaproteobacteria bacterium]|nr:hypothetical protein [Deltaproteobacteria bacterium]